MPGLRGVVVVAVALLDFLLRSGSLPVLPEGVLSIRLHSRTSDCRVPNAGGPRNASGSHL